MTPQSRAVCEILEAAGLRSPKRPHGATTMYHRDINIVDVEVMPHDPEKLFRVACVLRQAGFEVDHKPGYYRCGVTPQKRLFEDPETAQEPLPLEVPRG